MNVLGNSEELKSKESDMQVGTVPLQEMHHFPMLHLIETPLTGPPCEVASVPLGPDAHNHTAASSARTQKRRHHMTPEPASGRTLEGKPTPPPRPREPIPSPVGSIRGGWQVNLPNQNRPTGRSVTYVYPGGKPTAAPLMESRQSATMAVFVSRTMIGAR